MHGTKFCILSVTFLFLISLSFCQKQPEPTVPVTSTAISADGVSICYQVQRKGTPALVFIHGWCCNRSYWDLQVPYFSRKYKVVTIDLAGHGDSGLNRKDWTIAAFGEDVVAVVEKLGLDRVVLVGHSMGGSVILEAARRMPDKVIGLVGVDTFKNVENKYTQEQINGFMAPLHANFAETTSNFVRTMFIPNSDSALVGKIARDMSSAPPEIGIGELLGNVNYQNNGLTQALREVQVPIRCINSDMVPTNVEAAKKYAKSFEVNYMSDVGHFVMMEDPETFNRILEETVNEIVRANAMK